MAAGSLPAPVKTCQDVRAYIGADNSMTMDTFKNLMTAAGNDLSSGGGARLDTQCKLTAYVEHVVFVQHVLKTENGVVVAVSAEVVNDQGGCRLTNVSLEGC